MKSLVKVQKLTHAHVDVNQCEAGPQSVGPWPWVEATFAVIQVSGQQKLTKNWNRQEESLYISRIHP